MLSLYRRGRIYWVRGSVNGSRVRRKSLDTSDRVTAERRKRDMELEIDSGQSNLLWPQLAQNFLRSSVSRAEGTQRKYRFVIERFGRFLTERVLGRLSDIGPGVIADYIVVRQADLHPTRRIGVGAEGIKSDLRILRAAFGYAVKAGELKRNPVQIGNLGARVRNTQPFSDEEVGRMLADHGSTHGRRDLRAIVLTFLTTGFRIGDVVGLSKSAIDFERDQIIHRTEKRDKVVSLQLHAALKSELLRPRDWETPEQKSSPYLFPTETGNPMRNLDGALRRLWRRCKIQGGHAHRFRDTFSVNMLRQGASLYDVAQLLGITEAVCARHYAPYVRDLQERGARFIRGLSLPGTAEGPSTVGAQQADG